MIIQETLQISTRGRQTLEITDQIRTVVSNSGIKQGLCNIFIQHTSASLMLCENADPDVRTDMETFMGGLVIDGDSRFRHRTEGDDDMAAHIRSVLTESSITLPVTAGRCQLGTWQGIYLWEHRYHPHRRNVLITLYGE